MEHKTEVKGLPPNAYTELQPGETYTPIVPAEKSVAEITPRSVIIGVLMAFIFSGAAAFLGLKIAQVFEAAIPIAILAVGISYMLPKRSTILENVIIQSIGACSGAVVAGAIFTLPALFILQDKYPEITVNFTKIFMVSLLGGIMGILFLIFFRKYFVADMHGKFPFPEATATTEVLVTGEEGGKQAKVLAISMLVGAVYDFCVYTLEAWKEVFTTRVLAAGKSIADNWKLVFKLNLTSAVMGMGYIVGLKYASIICAGSFFAWYVIIPLIAHFGHNLTIPVPPATDPISAMDEEMIFLKYIRHIGIGGIACAGIIGILRSSGIILQAFTLGFKEMFQKKSGGEKSEAIRTQKDLKMSTVFILIVISILAVFCYFFLGVLAGTPGAFKLALIALLVVVLISFLFTSVAARAIAIVGTNPVSGMTLMTLIISSLILASSGLKGPFGMVSALLIGGVVCTSLSMSGSFITDLKIGYWIGATPVNQQRFKFLGTLIAALSVAGVMILLNQTYGFVKDAAHPGALPAPQANAMAAVIEPVMSGNPMPWILYIVGILMALMLEMIGIPPLAFMLGVYIPLELNTPLVAGGLLAHLIGKSHSNPKIAQQRKEKGTLIASGYIAGGAIIGVVSALIKWFVDETNKKYIAQGLQKQLSFSIVPKLQVIFEKMGISLSVETFCTWLGLAMFILLVIFSYKYATKGENTAHKEEMPAATES